MARAVLWKLWLGLVIVLSAMGLLLLWGAHTRRRLWRRAATAIPAAFEVDLSTADTYSGAFSQTCRPAHGLDVELDVEPPFQNHKDAVAALQGLNARLKIGGGEGRSSGPVAVKPDNFRKRPWSHSPLRENPEGLYVHYLRYLGSPRETNAKLTVEAPAPGIAGRKQRLVMRYALCGMETNVAPLIGAAIGVLLLLPAFGTALVVGWRAGSRGTTESASKG